ncbi:YdcF family protein [Terasakiella sp. A23]|uniref:YdcF family protein n=1 Tax=Terasakiella sp. FCG-A23 TaxID=3080561 RepID=UPI002955D85D|nr:YdcF family protein [Terasakiella sp. A23]MDV7338109.1 YdcF family protein [Terasakiella sp. A23]
MSGFGPKRKRRFIGPFFVLCLLICAVWTGGFIAFLDLVPRTVQDQDSLTDGIVVLTGGTKRLNTGLELLSDQKAQKMLISGVYRGVDLEELLSLSKESPQELECCIDIGHEADNTRGNARETADWVEKTGFQTVRLVTANYHMPRSLLEFSFHLPYTTIIAHPVFPEHVKVDQWWRWPGTAALLVGEYNKYLLVWVRQELARRTDLEILK